MSARQAIAYLLEDEGGYVHDPHDPGGETNMGISKRAYPLLPIALLTKADAEGIYRRDYWDAASCGTLPPPLGYALLDGAVNMGRDTAVRALQYALGVAQDGVVGALTHDAAWQAERHDALERLLTRRIETYVRLDGWGRYGTGWTRRVLRVHRRCLTTHWED